MANATVRRTEMQEGRYKRPSSTDTGVEITIRIADAKDLDHLVRQRRAMFAEMDIGSETELNAISESLDAYFRQAIADGSYPAYLAVNANGSVVAERCNRASSSAP